MRDDLELYRPATTGQLSSFCARLDRTYGSVHELSSEYYEHAEIARSIRLADEKYIRVSTRNDLSEDAIEQYEVVHVAANPIDKTWDLDKAEEMLGDHYYGYNKESVVCRAIRNKSLSTEGIVEGYFGFEIALQIIKVGGDISSKRSVFAVTFNDSMREIDSKLVTFSKTPFKASDYDVQKDDDVVQEQPSLLEPEDLQLVFAEISAFDLVVAAQRLRQVSILRPGTKAFKNAPMRAGNL